MEEYILSIDCGSQSIKAMIFNSKGDLLCKQQEKYPPYDSKYPNWAERSADVFWDKLCVATKKLKNDCQTEFEKVVAVCLTTQRDTVVFLDEDNNETRPAILWMDKRKQKEHKAMKPIYNIIMKIVSMYKIAVAVNKACPAHWVQKHQPEIWEKTKSYVLLSTYLNYKMTGVLKDNSANQIGHIPFNYKKSIWEHKLGMKAQMFQIDREKLCELIEPNTVLANITKKASEQSGIKEGLPYIPSGSDKSCETLGTSCLDEKTASISLGSQASVQISSKRYFEIIPFVPPFPSVVPKHYNPEIQIYKGYWMITWFKEEFAKKDVDKAKRLNILPEDLLNKSLEKIPIGSEGLTLQPFWGSVLENPEARGAMIGFSDVHTRYHMYRAIIEGIGYALKDGLNAIEKKSRVKIDTIMISGGGSISDEICQISADIFGKKVCKVQTYETSGLGSAIVGFKTLGYFDTYESAVENMVHRVKSFLPCEEANKKYELLFSRIYMKMYKNLKPMYDELYDLY